MLLVIITQITELFYKSFAINISRKKSNFFLSALVVCWVLISTKALETKNYENTHSSCLIANKPDSLK